MSTEMYYHVDIAGVRRHISILESEASEASALLDALYQWQYAAEQEDIEDLSGIYDQINRVSACRDWINNRIHFLDELQRKSAAVNQEVKSQLDGLV